jgi:GNAT superfamily N-acetyltransferase
MEVGLKKMTFPFGETYVSDGFEGAAFWNPPDGRPHGLLNDLKMLPSFLKVTTLRGLSRAISSLAAVEKKHPKEPHYYLLAIGVEPGLQGRGIGSQLLAPMLERCDREGMPSYLESSKEQNVPLYQRHGYRVVEEMRLGSDGPLVWRMWRDPQS